jgi:hypothetical protein
VLGGPKSLSALRGRAGKEDYREVIMTPQEFIAGEVQEISLPDHLEESDLSMSNFDGRIDEGMEEVLRAGNLSSAPKG